MEALSVLVNTFKSRTEIHCWTERSDFDPFLRADFSGNSAAVSDSDADLKSGQRMPRVMECALKFLLDVQSCSASGQSRPTPKNQRGVPLNVGNVQARLTAKSPDGLPSPLAVGDLRSIHSDRPS